MNKHLLLYVNASYPTGAHYKSETGEEKPTETPIHNYTCIHLEHIIYMFNPNNAFISIPSVNTVYGCVRV